ALVVCALRVSCVVRRRIGHPTLDITLADRNGRTSSVVGPVVTTGTHQGVLPLSCPSQCRLVGFALDRGSGELVTMTGTWSVTGVQIHQDAAWAPLDAQ